MNQGAVRVTFESIPLEELRYCWKVLKIRRRCQSTVPWLRKRYRHDTQPVRSRRDARTRNEESKTRIEITAPDLI